MSVAGAQSSLSWSKSLLLALPSFGLFGMAALVGPDTELGFALLFLAATYLILDLAFLQPWLVRTAASRSLAVIDLASWYREQLAQSQGEREMAMLLARANSLVAGSDRALFLVGAKLDTYGGTPADSAVTIRDPDGLHRLLKQTRVVYRHTLKSDSPTGMLLDELDYQVALPLRYRNEPLGLALLGAGQQRLTSSVQQMYTSIRIATSMGLSRHALGFNALHHSELLSIMDYARATQAALMPADRPAFSDGLLIHGVFRPAAQCGGDLWVWRSLGDGRIVVAIGDVTGHGIAPAMLSAAAFGAIQSYAIVSGQELDPAALLASVNRAIYQIAQASYMMTAFVAIIDRKAGRVRYANGGHNFPYLIRIAAPNAADLAADVQLKAFVSAGPMLGSVPEAIFETHEHDLELGDKLVLYTDGIPEAQSTRGKPFGERRLRAKLKSLAQESADAITGRVLDDLQQYMNGQPPGDDMTMVVVEWPRNIPL